MQYLHRAINTFAFLKPNIGIDFAKLFISRSKSNQLWLSVQQNWSALYFYFDCSATAAV